MLIKLVDAKYIADYKIHVTFNNGEQKNIDLKDHIWGEIFEPLKNKDFFKDFSLNPFTIEWPNGADFAPEFLYQIGQSKTTDQVKMEII
jgi:Protein of unknown function (DUF2442)